MMQNLFQGGVVICLLFVLGYLSLQSEMRDLNKLKKKKGWEKYLIILFCVSVLSLTSGEWAVMEALVAWNWNVECEIYSLHPCSLGGIPIFILKNTKEFFSCCFYCGSQNRSSELWLNSSIMCLIFSFWCMSGFLISEWKEKDMERR